jgi:hypothetical protein
MPLSFHGRLRVSNIRAIPLIAVVAVVMSGTLSARGAAAGASTSHVEHQPDSIDPKVLDLAMQATTCAVRSGAVKDPSTLTVIDYSRPSTSKRLWVFDTHSHALLYEELVAHGRGSGDNLPTHFSNDSESHESSLGLFVTGETYTGKNGYSLRLKGLESGVNDRAFARAIVMHGAPYVNDTVARTLGRLGRSWGCPALDQTVAHEVIDRVKGGSVVFAYYPDRNWLGSSAFLGGCAAAD